MAGDDPTAARAALEAEAERLRQARLAAEVERTEQERACRAAQADEATRVTPAQLRKALSRPMIFWVGVTCAVLAVAVLFVPTGPSTGDTENPTRDEQLAALVLLGVPGVLALLHHFTAISRARHWLSTLPFAVAGFEQTLGAGRAVTHVEVRLYFRDTPAAHAVVLELVNSRMGPDHQVGAGDGLPIGNPAVSRESANWPAARWFRKLVTRVILDIHRGYPITRLELAALKTDEFYISSGD